jgi:phospholipid/cholesterol/gamma-HCH transport system substrate-binding protein
MQQNNTVETIIGAIVVAVAVAFIVFAYRSTGGSLGGGYDISAKLARVDGISVGTDVRLSGIKIGTVSDMVLNPNYLVTVHMTIQNGIDIPDDSSLAVTSSGLLGSSYVSISPGGDDAMLKDGGQIRTAQGSVDLMGLVGRFIGGDNAQKPQPQPKPNQPSANNPPQMPAKLAPAKANPGPTP